MPVDALIFHDPPGAGTPPLSRLLAEVRTQLVDHQARLLTAAGTHVRIVPGRASHDAPALSFGEHLAAIVRDEAIHHLVVMGSGAVPRLTVGDARTLTAAAGAAGRRAVTNNRYSSDVVAISDATVLHDLPPLPGDNALPRWLEEHAGFEVIDLPGRERLALDLDSPLDIALWTLAPEPPAWARALAREHRLEVPRLDELRDLAADPRRELLVFGRSSARTLRWLERNVRCRVRFLAEERGLRASSPLAIGSTRAVPAHAVDPRPPRATLGRLLDARGPGALAQTVAELADGAIVDTRVLMADRTGADEDRWPSAEDRFASDLLRAGDVADPWLRELTSSAQQAAIPIVLGAHTLVGPGIPLLLQGVRHAPRARAAPLLR